MNNKQSRYAIDCKLEQELFSFVHWVNAKILLQYCILQIQAEENSLLFVPIPNKRFDGKAIYSFGKSTIYLDRNVIFMNNQGQWRPVSLPELVSSSR